MLWTDLSGLGRLSDIAAPALLIVGRVVRTEVESIRANVWKQLQETTLQDERQIN
jgi:hypothetical protein